MIFGNLFKRFGRATQAFKNSLLQEGEGYWWGGQLQGVHDSSPGAGINFTHEQAMTVAAVFACTRARSEIMASLPAMVYLELGDNVRRRHADNDLWRLLHDCPNPEMDSMTFYELMQIRKVNRGNGFAIIDRNNRDIPTALWPVHNSRVEPFRDDANKLNWRVYSDRVDARTERVRYEVVPDRNMLNVCDFGGNGYIAPGIVPMSVEEVSLNMAMTRYGAKFFKNGGRPSGVVEYPGYIDDDDDRAEFRADLNTLHSGPENWHKVAVLWNNAKFKELQFSPEQTQFIAGRNFSGKTFCQFYNVPPAVIQIFEDYKFATVDAMIQQWVMTCIRSDAIRFERALGRKVINTTDSKGRMVPLFNDPYVFEFVIEALLRGDSKKQAEVLEIERRNGVMNANEWRALSNREPLSGDQGERYVLPGGFEDLAMLGQRDSGGNSERSAGSTDAAAGDLPKFDAQYVAAHLESGVPKHRDRSRGGGVADAQVVGGDDGNGVARESSESAALAAEVLTKIVGGGGGGGVTTQRASEGESETGRAALISLAEAVGRIQSVTARSLERMTGNAEKTKAAWEKHWKLLEAAVKPACDIYLLAGSEPKSTAEELASVVVANLRKGHTLVEPEAIGLDVFNVLNEES